MCSGCLKKSRSVLDYVGPLALWTSRVDTKQPANGRIGAMNQVSGEILREKICFLPLPSLDMGPPFKQDDGERRARLCNARLVESSTASSNSSAARPPTAATPRNGVGASGTKPPCSRGRSGKILAFTGRELRNFSPNPFAGWPGTRSQKRTTDLWEIGG